MSADLLAVLLGFLAGVVSALFGVGGGLIFVPTLILLGKSSHVAVATSLAAMVPVILMGSWRQTRHNAVRWRDAVIIGVASVPTAYVGARIADALSDENLRRAFGVLLLAVAVQMAVRALRQAPEPAGSENGPVTSNSAGIGIDSQNARST